MSDYVTDGLTTDPDELLTGMIEDFQTNNPGWVPYDAAPEVQLMSIFATRLGVTLDVASQVLTAIYRYFGLSIAGVPPLEATFARVDATFTFIDDTGYTVPDGLRVNVATSGNTAVRFLVDGDQIVPNGDTTAVLPLVAETAGAEASGLTGAATDVDGFDYIISIVPTSATSGGEDGETDADYLERLTRRQRRTSDKILTAADAETALLDDVPGIGRVLIIDNYIPAIGPDPEQFDVPGAFTAVVAAADGSDVSGDTKTAAEALIERDRILNIDGYVIDPTRTNVTVAWTGEAYAGYVPADVKAAGDAAVVAYFSGAGWGLGDTTSAGPTWVEDLIVRYSELYALLNLVPGLNHVTDVKINGASNTNATLTGPGALPNLTAVTSTVT